MSSENCLCEERYTHGKPFVNAKIVVVNENNGKQTTIDKNFWIDTGFDGGLHIAALHSADITLTGIIPRLGPISVAGGGKSKIAHRCFAYLRQIGDYELPMPGIEVELILHGESKHGLLGLDILKHWTIKFDGPNRFFIISKSNQE